MICSISLWMKALTFFKQYVLGLLFCLILPDLQVNLENLEKWWMFSVFLYFCHNFKYFHSPLLAWQKIWIIWLIGRQANHLILANCPGEKRSANAVVFPWTDQNENYPKMLFDDPIQEQELNCELCPRRFYPKTLKLAGVSVGFPCTHQNWLCQTYSPTVGFYILFNFFLCFVFCSP